MAATTAARTRLEARVTGSTLALAAAVLGSVAVNSRRADGHRCVAVRPGRARGGVTGLQWLVDGYTLMSAALPLSSGSLADRIGAHRAFGFGIGLFVVASVARSPIVAGLPAMTAGLSVFALLPASTPRGAVVMAALTFGDIEAGSTGLPDPIVLAGTGCATVCCSPSRCC